MQNATGWTIYKCGVTHTGQRHQLHKLRRIEEQVGRPPVALIAMWFLNDISNDHYFPHSTVIEGWLVDRVATRVDGTAVTRGLTELTTTVEQTMEAFEAAPSPSPRSFHEQALHYSLTLNLVSWLRDRLFPATEPPSGSTVEGSSTSVPTRLGTIYGLKNERDGRLFYRDNPAAAANKQALLDLKKHAESVGALLVVLVIPPRTQATDPSWHRELHEFLDANGIRFIDLATVFEDMGENADTIFLMDGHFNRYGNRVIAELIEQELGPAIDRLMIDADDGEVTR